MFRILINRNSIKEDTGVIIDAIDEQEALKKYKLQLDNITNTRDDQYEAKDLNNQSPYDKFINALKSFESLQNEYSDFGASDSEPFYQYRKQIKRMVSGEEYEELDEYGWELFYGMRGVKRVAREMSASLCEMYSAYKQMDEEQTLKALKLLKMEDYI